MKNRLVIGVTGATGQIYAIKALELLQETDYETHLVISDGAYITLNQEGGRSPADIEKLANVVHPMRDIGASIASGSFATAGMLVAPCSMKTLSNIAHGNAANLITRSADVTLKERRPLVLMPREKPFNRIHLKNMLEVTDAGGIIMPPFPSFYQNLDTIDEMVERTIVRALSMFDIELPMDEWTGLNTDQE